MNKETTKVVCHNCWWEAEYYDGILEAGCFSCGGPLAIKGPQEPPAPTENAPLKAANLYRADINKDIAAVAKVIEAGIKAHKPAPEIIAQYEAQIAAAPRPPSINKTADKPTVKMTIRLDMDVYNALWELHAESHKSYVSLINEQIRGGLAATREGLAAK